MAAMTFTPAYSDDDQKMVERVNAWLADSGRTGAELCRLTGIKEGTRSSILNGSYISSPTKFLRRMLEVIERVDERQGSRNDIPYTQTSIAVQIEAVCKRTHINIIFVEDQPDMSDGGSRGRGKVQASNQFWLILLSVRNVADAGTAAQIDSGELIGQVLEALQGHELSAQHQPLYRQKCPFRHTDKSGFTYFPFLFSTKVITGANRG